MGESDGGAGSEALLGAGEEAEHQAGWSVEGGEARGTRDHCSEAFMGLSHGHLGSLNEDALCWGGSAHL